MERPRGTSTSGADGPCVIHQTPRVPKGRRGVSRTLRFPPIALNLPRIDYLVRRNAKAAGLTGVHAYALRHSCASLALAGGASLTVVRDLLGHSSVVTTSRYLDTTTGGRAATICIAGMIG